VSPNPSCPLEFGPQESRVPTARDKERDGERRRETERDGERRREKEGEGERRREKRSTESDRETDQDNRVRSHVENREVLHNTRTLSPQFELERSKTNMTCAKTFLPSLRSSSSEGVQATYTGPILSFRRSLLPSSLLTIFSQQQCV
jgi:hypothetical protein